MACRLALQRSGTRSERPQLITRPAITRIADAGGVDGPPREIQYKGPRGRERRIKLDIADDELVIEAQSTALIGRYSDQSVPLPSITTYALSEVVAEKLRCVIQRVQCRDPFDLHRLLVEQGIEMQDAWPLFEQKAEHKGLDPDRFDGRFDEREPMYRRR